MAKEESLNLGINPRPINETEARQLALVLNLLKYKSGLNFQKIRSLMPEYYSNENKESDQKKIHRDIEELKNLGFSVNFHKVADSGDLNIYRISIPIEEKKIQFQKEELSLLSMLILEKFDENFSPELFSACQKIFHQNMDLFPFKEIKQVKNPNQSDAGSEVFFSIVKAIKNRTPLKIQYFRTIPSEKEEKEIDPIHIIKRNSNDFYLIAFDRKKGEKRRYLIPKILKVSDLGGDFLRDYKINPEDLNYHALNFKVHEPVELELIINESLVWKLENFLYPHPFTREKDRVVLNTTNQTALFSFLWKENEVILKVNSSDFRIKLENFFKELENHYSFFS
ncbi:MAG: WYL domain-containing protein [Leptospiraceae bacterium]|nr:WYL domain-containing protein [Leptospiraceae bacterium]